MHLASPVGQTVQKDGAHSGLWGSLWTWGSCVWTGVQLSRYPAAWAPWSLSPPIIGKDAVGAAGRMPVWTTLHPRSPYGIPLARCMHSSNQFAKHGGSRPRYPNDIVRGDRLAMCSAFPWEAGFAACLRGCCAHLFPQLVLVNDAFQLLCQLCVLLAELHVPLALLLDLSLDFTQRALEMISNFFPLLIFLPCPLNRFLLL